MPLSIVDRAGRQTMQNFIASHEVIGMYNQGDASSTFDSLLESTVRQLPLNSPTEIEVMKTTLGKIVNNILENPYDLKFRTLRLQNKTLRERLFNLHGAKEIMSVLNFKRMNTTDPPEAAMIFQADSSQDSFSALREAWVWLEQQFDATQGMEGSKRPNSTCCAECSLMIRLPSGSIVKAAFYSFEPLRAVRDYLNLTIAVSDAGLFRSIQICLFKLFIIRCSY